jgi:hypothetical protein
MKRILLLPLILIIGCYSPKKAEKQLDKAKDKYPALVAQKTSNWYPCKEIEIKTDSSAYKGWLDSINSILGGNLYIKPDTNWNNREYAVHITDTIEITTQECTAYKNKIIAISSQLTKAKQTINLIRSRVINPPAIHDTIIKLDSTQIVILSEKLKQSEAEKEKHEKKHGFWFKFGISFLVAFLISLIFNILKHTKW